MFCDKCGKELLSGSVFCSFCGNKIQFVTPAPVSYEQNDIAEIEGFKQCNSYKEYVSCFHMRLYRFQKLLFWIEIGLMLVWLISYVGGFAKTEDIITAIVTFIVTFMVGIYANKGHRLLILLFPSGAIFLWSYLCEVDLLQTKLWMQCIIPVVWLIFALKLRTKCDEYNRQHSIKEKEPRFFSDEKYRDKVLFIVGLIIVVVGVIATVWANNYEPSFEEEAEKIFFGEKSEGLRNSEAIKKCGPVIIVVGAAMMAYLLYRSISQKGEGKDTVISEKTSVEKLKEYKELLDSGIITQEEFDKMKAEILQL